MAAQVSRSLRQRIISEFQGLCAYCHTATSITGAALVIDHIIPESLGGKTELPNLCLACHSCNEFKGAQVEAEDPSTRSLAPLFHPRLHQWTEHFRWDQDGGEIIGLTPTGRATVAALNMNHSAIVHARKRWAKVGWHPPEEDR